MDKAPLLLVTEVSYSHENPRSSRTPYRTVPTPRLGSFTNTGMVIEGRIDSGTFHVSKSKNSIACATLDAEPGESTDICKSGLNSFGRLLDDFATNL